MSHQGIPGPCFCCNEWLDEYACYSRDQDGRVFCVNCYDMTEQKRAPSPRLCRFCKKSDVQRVQGYEPYTTEHWACPRCDSTYCLEEYE